MRRLFRSDSGRSLVVALDHGFFAVPADLPAIEDLAAVVDTVTGIHPDGVLMSAGQARLLGDMTGRSLPALTVRCDVTNLYLSPPRAESELLDDAGAASGARSTPPPCSSTCSTPTTIPSCASTACATCSTEAQCEHFGMPMMVEPIPMERRDGRYHDVADESRLVPLVRQAVEAGAEVIKAGILPTTDGMQRAIRVAGGVPYLARGGGKIDDREVLAATRHLLDCGAAGIVFGRNIFQHDDPAAMAAALRALVHDDASVDKAAVALGS